MPWFRQAPLTTLLILLNLLVYLASGLCGGSFLELDNRTLVACGGLYGPAVLQGGEWWRLLSAMFLHGGPEHLALNMLSLLIVGRMMEIYYSRGIYLALYFASGIEGFLFSLFAHPFGVSVGASGAIFGLFGAIGGFALFHRRRLGERYRVFMREFGVILGLNMILGLLIPSIDMSAHLGGLVLGFVGGYLAIRSRGAFWAFLAGTALVSAWIAAVWLPAHTMILLVPAA